MSANPGSGADAAVSQRWSCAHHPEVAGEPVAAAEPALWRLERPVLLMSVPLYLSALVPNNAWMEAMTPSERTIDQCRAFAQFHAVYSHLVQTAVVYLLPSTPGLQDQTYVSNLGAVLPHRNSGDTVIVSRFRSKARVGEEAVGTRFFHLMGFDVRRPPETFDGQPVYFEGEADLKHIRGNLFIGAHGMRTSLSALAWASASLDVRIVPFRMIDPYLYHLDCCLFRVTDDAILLCTSVADRSSLKRIESCCEVIDVSLEQAHAGVTNGLLLSDELVCDSDIAELPKNCDQYYAELAKLDFLERVCARFGLGMRAFSMSEFYKSGALLSCLVMPIHRP